MAYSNNPNLPHVRMEAVRMVHIGQSVRAVARHFGFTHSAVVKWVSRARMTNQRRIIPTRSSRPHHHPHTLDPALELAILEYRKRYRRCAFFIHHMLRKDGYPVSLSSVERTLRRHELTRYTRWKKWHTYPPRPLPEKPGLLVEIDTIHDGPHTDRLYLYTLLDVHSRWSYAWPTERITTHRSLRFVSSAQTILPFSISTLQSDHGSEFSKWFTKQVASRGMAHRHSRVRQPNDNAHLERFNRTIQEECLNRVPRSLRSWRREIPQYLTYYNEHRPHMGLSMKTPLEIIKAVPRY